MTEVKLVQGTVLYEAGETIAFVYFPLSGMVSTLVVLQDGNAIEVAVIGREGYIGGYFGPRGWRSLSRTVMQTPGDLLRLDIRHFKRMLDSDDEFRALICGYKATVYFQAQQTAACQAMHSVEARLCRWLLQAEDAIGGGALNLTQEVLSQMMGVRRTSISGSANKLRADGLISYRRGVIHILDRKRLEQRACECYGAIRHALAESLPQS